MKAPLLALLLTSFLAIPATTSSSLVDTTLQSIVKVEFQLEGEPGEHFCTGFVVSATRGEVLTARHCIPADEGQSPLVDGRPSTVLKKNGSFALLSIAKMTKPPLTLREKDGVVLEPVWSFGFAWGRMVTFGRHVAAYTPDGDTVVDGPLAPGMSGGPVVDAEGAVVGINQASNDVIGVACGVEEIRAFLAKP